MYSLRHIKDPLRSIWRIKCPLTSIKRFRSLKAWVNNRCEFTVANYDFSRARLNLPSCIVPFWIFVRKFEEIPPKWVLNDRESTSERAKVFVRHCDPILTHSRWKKYIKQTHWQRAASCKKKYEKDINQHLANYEIGCMRMTMLFWDVGQSHFQK